MKFSRAFHKKLRACDDNLIKQFRTLSFGYSGQMCRWLDEFSQNAYVFFIYDNNKKVAAWAICNDRGYYGVVPVGFYTKQEYRRLGLGSRLAKYMTKYHHKLFDKKIEYYPHDQISKNFFKQCWEKNNFDIKAINKNNYEY